MCVRILLLHMCEKRESLTMAPINIVIGLELGCSQYAITKKKSAWNWLLKIQEHETAKGVNWHNDAFEVISVSNGWGLKPKDLNCPIILYSLKQNQFVVLVSRLQPIFVT